MKPFHSLLSGRRGGASVPFCSARVLWLCFLLLSLSLSSCSNSTPDKAKTKVRLVCVGRGYTNTGANELGSYKARFNGQPWGTIRDVLAFSQSYTAALRSAGISYDEPILMLESGREVGPINDADLRKPEYDHFPTYGHVKSVLTSIASLATENDLTVFYYSGHGAPPLSDDECEGAGSLVLVDDHISGFPYPTKYMAPSEIASLLDAIPGYKVAIFDSCYSANIAQLSSDAAADYSAGMYLDPAHRDPLAYFVGPFAGNEKLSVIAGCQYNNASTGDYFGDASASAVYYLGWDDDEPTTISIDGAQCGLKSGTEIIIANGAKKIESTSRGRVITSGSLFSAISHGITSSSTNPSEHYSETLDGLIQVPARSCGATDILMCW